MFCFTRPAARRLLSHEMIRREISFSINFPERPEFFLKMTSLSLDEKGNPLQQKLFRLSKENLDRCWHLPNLEDNHYEILVFKGEFEICKKTVNLSQDALVKIIPSRISQISSIVYQLLFLESKS